MNPFVAIKPATFVAAFIAIAAVAGAESIAENRVIASLVPATSSALPGSAFDVAIHFTIPPGWHMYWLNAGDTGAPPTVKWNLPPGISAGEPKFPAPQRLSLPQKMTAYGYERELTLFATITVDPNFDADRPIDLAARVQWVVCSDQCVMEKQDVATTVAIGPMNFANDAQISAWRAQQPKREAVDVKDVYISVGPAGRGMLSVSMPHDLDTASEIEFFAPPLDFVAFDEQPMLHAIVGGMSVAQPFKIEPGQHPPADSVTILTYFDSKQKRHTFEIPFKTRFDMP